MNVDFSSAADAPCRRAGAFPIRGLKPNPNPLYTRVFFNAVVQFDFAPLFFEIHLTETQKYDRDKSVRGMSPARLSSKTKTVYHRYEYYYHCDCGRVAADTTKALLCRACGALCDKLSMSRLRPFIPCVSCAYA